MSKTWNATGPFNIIQICLQIENIETVTLYVTCMSVYLAHIETVTLYVTCMSVYLAPIETEPCKKLKCHLTLRARWQIIIPINNNPFLTTNIRNI